MSKITLFPVNAMRFARFAIMALFFLSTEARKHKDSVLYLYDKGPTGAIEEYTDRGNLKPEFLFPSNLENAGPRLVEIYAPWCPHCLKFRGHMIELSKQLQALARASGVMDFSVHALSCVAHKEFCRKYGIQGFPRLLAFKRHESMAIRNATELFYWEAGPLEIMKNVGITVSNETAESILPKSASDTVEWDQNRVEAFRSIDDIYNDAFHAFTMGLRTSLFDKEGSLERGRRIVFRRWLILLSRAIPPHLSLHKLVLSLLRLFSQVVHDEKYLVQVLDQIPPPEETFSISCTHGIDAAGYSCGLWELLHMVTVGVVEWNEIASDAGVDENERYSTYIGLDDAGTVIRDYIDLFFACDVCRKHFVKMYDDCEVDRCERLSDEASHSFAWHELPLWLMETHNKVNIRLLEEQAERQKIHLSEEDKQKVVWPQKKFCPQCWTINGTINKREAYEHLKDSYWMPKRSDSHEFLKSRMQVFAKQKDAFHLKVRNRLEASSSDQSEEPSSILSLAWSPVVFLLFGLLFVGSRANRNWKSKAHKKL